MNGRCIGVLAVALACGLAGCAPSVKVGAAAPAFAGTDADGRAVTLAAHQGTVLILEFWAVW